MWTATNHACVVVIGGSRREHWPVQTCPGLGHAAPHPSSERALLPPFVGYMQSKVKLGSSMRTRLEKMEPSLGEDLLFL